MWDHRVLLAEPQHGEPTQALPRGAQVLLVGAPEDRGRLEAALAASPAAALSVRHADRPEEAAALLRGDAFGCVLLASGDAAHNAVAAVRDADAEAAVLLIGGDDDDVPIALAAGAQEHLGWDEVSPRALARAMRYALERRRAELDLAFEILHDPVTGLPNQALLIDHLRAGLGRAQRVETCVAVIVLDVEGFRLVNETLGPGAGDEVLFVVGDRLRAALRPGDTVGRYGGDEFLVVSEGVLGEDAAVGLATRLSEAAAAEPVCVDGRDLPVRLTAGVAIAEGRESPEEVLREAQAALSQARRRGDGEIALYDALGRAHEIRRLELRADLMRAIEQDELLLHFQPQIDLSDGRVVSAEALVRWNHPRLGLVAPAEFVPEAEETGAIVALGEHVLAQGCRQLAAWQREGGGPPRVSVNLSLRQVSAGSLPSIVARCLEDSGADPDGLWLELTETAAMSDIEATARVLDRLRGLGVHLALDDFGTGWSSLSWLGALPVELVKIDRSFVSYVDRDPKRRRVAAAIVGLSEGLGLMTLAEGVERPEEHAVLMELGCTLAQGHLFGRAGPATLVPRRV